MKKDLRILFLTEFEDDISEPVRYLKDAGYKVEPVWLNLNEAGSTLPEADRYDIVILGITGSRQELCKIMALPGMLETEIPIVAISDETTCHDFLDTLDKPLFDSLLIKEMPLIGRVVKQLLREAHYKNEQDNIKIICDAAVADIKKLEEDLKKSRDYYLTLFESFPALIWRSGCNKKCNYFNKVWLDFTGRTLEQEMGDGWTEGVHPQDIGMCFEIYSKSFDSRESFEMEYRLRHKDGQYRWILDIGRPFYDLDNNFSGYIGACFDITERKIAEEGLRRYRLLSQNANDIILFADISGNVIEANDAAIKAYGYAKEELLSKTIFYLVNPDPTSPVGVNPYQADTAGIYYEAAAYRKDGSTFTAEVSMQCTEIGSSKVIMAILRDVSERKRINEELKRTKESAEAANLAKSEFLANMSHEIRTPLNGMVGMIDLTLMTDLDEEQRDNLYTAKECSSTLLNLINDILDFSKIEARKLTIEYLDFNLRELLDQTIKPHLIKAQEKRLALRLKVHDEIPPVLNGDPYRLKQVINNLVGNAVKFTDSGEVSLSVRLNERNSDSLELEFLVSDTGIGMTPEDMNRLFSIFSQVDSSYTRKYGGSGLGLAISKQLVEKMGGSIWVKSMIGIGSSFYFTVRLGIGNLKSNSTKAVSYANRTKYPLRILLVEDDRVNQLVITRMLEETGHKVITVNNGLEALRTLKSETVDAILMDIQMPEMDGIETTRRIRTEEASTGRHIPIIAHTAYALQGDKEKFLSAGMDGYISKPIDINSFFKIMEELAESLAAPKKSKINIGNKGNESIRFKSLMAEHSKRMEYLIAGVIENINHLRLSFEHGDLPDIERYSHMIKKLSSEIGANTVKNAAFKVELAARRSNMIEAAEYFRLVVDEFSKYKKQLTD